MGVANGGALWERAGVCRPTHPKTAPLLTLLELYGVFFSFFPMQHVLLMQGDLEKLSTEAAHELCHMGRLGHLGHLGRLGSDFETRETFGRTRKTWVIWSTGLLATLRSLGRTLCSALGTLGLGHWGHFIHSVSWDTRMARAE